MSRKADTLAIVNLLVNAALGRSVTMSEPWDYGWSIENYRRSPSAAMAHDRNKGVSLRPEAVAAFEQASTALLRISAIRDRYDPEEFWSVVASLVGTLPMDASRDTLQARITDRVNRLVNPSDSHVLLPLANVASTEGSLEIGPMLIGHWEKAFEERFPSVRASGEAAGAAASATGGETADPEVGRPWWASPSVREAPDVPPPLLLAHQSRFQLGRAIREAESAFEDLVAVALMLEPDLEALSLYGLRGSTHRPGTKGLVIDRASLARAAGKNPTIQRELGAETLVSSIFGQTRTIRWYGESPFPLQQLLKDKERRVVSERILDASTKVYQRLRLAARWHAKAYWASEPEDGVLALGICFDSMLTEKGPTPGRVLAERFAFLAPDPDVRWSRYRLFMNEFYPARSTVAHGAKGTSLDGAFVRRMAKEARLVFRRLLQLSEAGSVRTEKDLENMYATIKWGGPRRAT
jgi:hypothetical protein